VAIRSSRSDHLVHEHSALDAGHYAAIVGSSADAILSEDREGRITSWNAAAERLYGYTSAEAIGQPTSMLIPPENEREAQEIFDRVLTGQDVAHYEAERIRKDGGRVAVSVTLSPIEGPDGQITGASIIARDITERRRAEERNQRLQRLTDSLSHAITPDRAVEVLLAEVVPALEADAGTVGFVDNERQEIRLSGNAGYTKEAVAEWERFPLDDNLPMSEAVRTGQPVWCGSIEELRARYPALKSAVRFQALAVVPLVVEGEAFGAVALSFREPHGFPAEERGFMVATVQQVAHTLARARVYEAERSARLQLAFLAEASELLTESLDLDSTLQKIAVLAVPTVADWCGVDLVEPDGATRVVAVAHVDPAKVELARELRERYPQDPDAPTGLPAVVRTGRSELYSEITDDQLVALARDDHHLRLLRELGLSSGMIVPLSAHGRTLGALTLALAESERRYGADDLEFAEDLARRAASAVENSIMYRDEHEAAVTLQRALLPRELPKPAGVRFAGRYLPAGVGLEVGGDWYDVLERPDGRVLLVIGDVAGRGIRAASIMGQLRTAVRAYAMEGHSAVDAVQRLHQVAQGFDEAEMATLIHLTLDPATRTAEFVRAGHPPALIRAADATVTELASEGCPPIGIFATARHRSERARFDPGSTVLFYTDGLIERRSEGIDPGLARLKDAFEGAPEEPGECLDFIVDALGASGADDDVALLAMRFLASAEGALRLELPARTTSLAGMRRALESWLVDAGVGGGELHDVVAACNEACANAIEHAYGPSRGGSIEVEADRREDEVIVEVRDRGEWREPRGRNRGRGLEIVKGLMDEVELDSDRSGTRVRMGRRLEGEDG
jgi:PAS domain S-box-containing protein